MTGPSPHLSWEELACRDTLRTPYPLDYRRDPTRLDALCAAFEHVRAAVGVPIVISDGYRTPAHNAAVGGVPNSQHIQGRALDLQTPLGLMAVQLFALVKSAPGVHGAGLYDWGVHMDVRPGPTLVTWDFRTPHQE